MYSIVLLAAMTAGESTPQWFFRGGCCGCYGGGWGCCGGWGWGCGGCYGCCGGWGCCGSGYGWGGHGCYGMCYGACYGLGYGGWGAPYAGYGPGWAGYACAGCCGGYASYAYGAPGPVVGPSIPPAGGAPPVDGKGKGPDGEQVRATNRARLIVDLPADGKLYVDDKQIANASSKRTFQTPVLEKGQEYYYEVRAEVMRDGKPVSETKRIIVKAGSTIRADFSSLGAASGVASAKKSR